MSTLPRLRTEGSGGGGRRRDVRRSNAPGGLDRIAQLFGRRWLTDWPRQAWDMVPASPSRRHSLIVLVVGTVIALVNLAIVIYADLDWVWADGRARLTIARSILDNKQPGFTQFGNTWLPLHPAMMLPFIWIDWAFRSGAAGIAVSTVSLVGTLYYTHRFVMLLTRSGTAAWVALIALSLSPNFMFMAGTPMSETPFAALTMGAWYYLVKWSKDPPRNQSALTIAGLFTGAAAMIRYEAWFFLPAGVAYMIMTRLQYGSRPTVEWQRRMEAELLAYVALVAFPIFLFVVYNWLIFGTPTAFLSNNEQAVAEQAAGLDLTGNWRNVLLNLGYTGLDNIGWLATAAAVAGLVVYAAVARRPVGVTAILLPATSVLFFVVSLYSGGSVLRHDAVYEGFGLLNARYGVIAIPAAAVGIGVLAAFGRLPALIALAVIGIQFGSFMTSPQPVITVRDATQSGYRHFEATSTLFNELYDGGDVLMSLRDHAQMIPALHIPLRSVMHEGVSQVEPHWEQVLADPAPYVRWIVIRERGQGRLDELISPLILARDFEEVGVVSLEFPHFVERIYRVRPGAGEGPRPIQSDIPGAR